MASSPPSPPSQSSHPSPSHPSPSHLACSAPPGTTGSRPSLASVTGGALVAEMVGTFMFTFSGTGTVLAVHDLRHAAMGFTSLDDLIIGTAFAFGVVAAVYATASASGAHLNPAVTIALGAVGRFPWRMVPGYVVAQLIGGLLAALVDWFMYPGLRTSLVLGTSQPGIGVPWWRATLTEFVITLILMAVVMATAVFEQSPGSATQAGISIGLWVGAAIFLALPISGASINPARTLGPDIVAGQFPYWWVYLVGPIAGAIVGAALWQLVVHRGSKEVVANLGASNDGASNDSASNDRASNDSASNDEGSVR